MARRELGLDGVEDRVQRPSPRRHLALVASGRVATVLVSPAPFSDQDLVALALLQARMHFQMLVVPPQLLEPIARLRTAEDVHVPAPEQIALAELLRSGGYERHVRRMRARYRARRDRLVEVVRHGSRSQPP